MRGLCGGLGLMDRMRVRIRREMFGDPNFKCIKSGAIDYMRWEVIPLLDAAGKK